MVEAQRNKCRRFSMVLPLVLLGVFAGTGLAFSSNLAQVPLFLNASVDPNILFIIDDSGSMHFEVMPDEPSSVSYRYNARYAYPRTSGVYGGGDYDNYVPTFTDNMYNSFYRSSVNNKMYYNPAITYKPWVKYDGSSYTKATSTAAWHNPENTGAGSRDLTASTSQSARWVSCTSPSSCSSSDRDSSTFWPAVYFWPKSESELGADVTWDAWNFSHYHKVEIRSSTTEYVGHGRENRSDCADRANRRCTYAEEIQNFANWYTFYRSRILAARAGIGRAFVDQSTRLRVGFGAINKSSSYIEGRSDTGNLQIGTIIRGVRPFSGTNKQNFYSDLYGSVIPNEGTPLRKALDDAGRYFSWTNNRGPWGKAPGTDDSSAHLTCRSSYSILMTDGYWSEGSSYDAGTSGARENTDGTTSGNMSPPIAKPGGGTWEYAVEHPFRDAHSNTLADVAMYYWKRDLRTDLSNRVPTTPINPAFWQNMVTFGVGFGVTGSIQPEDAWTALKNKTAIAWPDPTASEPAKLDDLLHAAVNSRGGFFSASDPEAFAKGLSDVLKDITSRGVGTAAAIATNSTRVLDDTLIYQARFDSEDWSGQIRAYKINNDGGVGALSWDTDGKISPHGSRRIYTWDASASVGISFFWDNLTAAQKTALKGTDTEDSKGQERLDWLRGDDSKEAPSGSLRKRNLVLGDIVNSDPLVVGTPNFGYEKLPSGTAGQDSYASFREGNKNRRKMVYVGANDGMLHAFDAKTGEEKFAYVPNLVFAGLKSLTDPAYTHRYFVDGPPVVGDVYLDGAWKTILVGTLGAGGKGIFALDITDPDTFGESKVLWEFTHADLGYVLGPPVIGRMQDGTWAVVLGNGYEGTSKQASLFVVKLSDGSLLQQVPTPAGSSTSPNGLSTVTLLSDENRTLTHAYGGDLLGNLWKFDLTGSQPRNWDVAHKSGNTAEPLFRAMAGSNAQPITAPPEIGAHPDGDYMVYFGTGKYFEAGDNQGSSTSPVQSFYGIWDKSGNNTQITKTDRSDLQQQTITHEQSFSTSENLRVVSGNAVNWTSKRGWYLDLRSPVTGVGTQGERVVSSALLRHGRVIFTTLIPSTDPCDPGGSSWLMELVALTGGRPTKAVFDVNKDKDVDKDDLVEIIVQEDGVDKKVMVAASGMKSKVGIIKTPAVISAGTLEYRYSGGSLGDIMVLPGAGSEDDRLGRRSWREVIAR